MHLFNYYPSKSETDARLEKKIFKHSLIFPGFFVLCFWLILLVETTLDYDFTRLGIFPLHLKGLKGFPHLSIADLNTLSRTPFPSLSCH